MSKTYFVSGHLDLSPEEFADHYVPRLNAALAETPRPLFVVGDARGTDDMAQRYLRQHDADVVVHHMYRRPRHCAEGCRTQGGFTSDNARDRAMTLASDDDIAWVRSEAAQKAKYGAKYRRRKSGTEKNLERRQAQSS